MAFSTPTFNLTANIWNNTGVRPPVGPPTLTTACQLRYPGRGPTELIGSADPTWMPEMRLLVPKLTDIRDPSQVNGPSLAEVPAGSGRFYVCWVVDDVAKGFPNEYRMAWLRKEGEWPAPMP